MIPDLSDLPSESIRQIVNAAIGRLLRMGSRPEAPGDAEAFYNIRSVFLAGTEAMAARGEWKSQEYTPPPAAVQLSQMRRAGFSVD